MEGFGGVEAAGFGIGHEGEFAAGDVAGEAAGGLVEEVGEHEGRGLEVIQGEEDEARVFGEGLAAEGEEFGKAGFDFPEFAVGAAAIGGRVEDDGVVADAAADFAAEELEGVVEDPADGGVVEIGEGLVVAAPGDGGLGGVYVGDGEASGGGGEGGDAGVAEEVEEAEWGSRGE
jgi:hypothetical protein